MVSTLYEVSGVGPTLYGRNGEGDRYDTDGEIRMATLVVAGRPQPQPPTELPSPPFVTLKNAIWSSAADGLAQRRREESAK